MYQTLSTSESVDILIADQYAGWSRAGARALVEYLEQVEEESGERIEIDPVAIRCDFSEYDSALQAAVDYGWEADADMEADAQEEAALLWLSTQTEVIDVDGRVIIGAF